MSKKRLYEIAKELGKESKEVVARAKELGLDVKSHSSSVEEAAASKIVASFKPAPAPKVESKPVAPKPVVTKEEAKPAAPVAPKEEKSGTSKTGRVETLRLSVKHVQKSRLNDASKIRVITVTINKMGIVKKMITVMVVNKVKAIATTVDSMIKVKTTRSAKSWE